MALQRWRARLPLVAFILLTLICLLLLGFACACLTEQPAQAIERSLSAMAALPAPIVLWPLVTAAALALAARIANRPTQQRRSRAVLQSFLL